MRKNYLVIIDESDELKNAIYFAAKRSVINNANLIMILIVKIFLHYQSQLLLKKLQE